jgi:ATP/maltotriose-dependent transcriptional regulator MalT/DNA-binding SARP family transcriptional activator
LVKLSRPRLFDVVPRPQLYAKLSILLRHPLVWIAGAPGSGKTTLLASYVESRRLPCLWYQVDPGDTEPATLFHYLTVALAEHSRGRATLPRFAPEFLTDLRGFSRRFFRELFSQLRASSVLVFDSFEDADASPALIEVLRTASEEVPHHSNLVILSRADPPAAFAQLAMNQAMAVMEASCLRLTEDEARAMSRLAGLDRPDTVRALYEQADGWTAGVRLLVEQARRGASLAAPEQADSRQHLFDYFAEQVFAHAEPAVERTLVRLAALPRMTAELARKVSGSEDCGRILDDLARRHLFVERRPVAPASRIHDRCVYQFHTLFQTFLREHALRTLGQEGLRQLAFEGAQAMEASDWMEEAIGLYLEAGEWDKAVRLLRRAVPHLLREGRFGLLQRWLSLLPPERRDGDPWLLYWSGSARSGQEPATARALFERAYTVAREREEHALALRCAAAIVQTLLLEYTQFAPLDHWIDVLQKAVRGGASWADPGQELCACSALLTAMLYRRGDPPALAAVAARTMDLLHEELDADLELGAAIGLLSYGSNLGKPEVVTRVERVVEPLLVRSDLSPLRRALCAYFVAWGAVMRADQRTTQTALERLRGMAEEFEVPRLKCFAVIIAFWHDFLWHPSADLGGWIREFERVMDPTHPYDVAALHALRAWLCQSSGDAAEGLRCARVAIDAFEAVGSPWHRLLARGLALHAAVELGDAGRSQGLMSEMRRIAASTNVRVHDSFIHQSQAWRALQRGDETLLVEHLHELFAQARAFGTGTPTRFVRSWMARLAAEALRRNIETNYVRQLITTYRWAPPAPELEEWPFPVRVRVLGHFEIEVDGRPLAFGGKAPRKTLALLKALVCMGGTEVRDHQLIDALWPDEEADAARTVFGVTLHRLRRLIATPDAVAVNEGCVSLNCDRVWVDAMAFERLLAASATPADEEVTMRALALYKGPLLPCELDASWSAAYRERLRAKFVHHLAGRGRELEAQGRWEEAITLYLRGLDADTLNESFYRGLMRAHHLSGRRAEAMSLYARLQQALHDALGIEPSRETQALYEQISQAQAGTRQAATAWRRRGNGG